jgi:hypothetical protein
MLGIPTVQDRYIQQMLLQVLTPIFDPELTEDSYGFRPGRSAQDAVHAGPRRSWRKPSDVAQAQRRTKKIAKQTLKRSTTL